MQKSGYEYRCSAGESFDMVALKIYGNEKYAKNLLEANPSLCSITIFSGGERLQLPALTAANSGAYTPATAPWRD